MIYNCTGYWNYDKGTKHDFSLQSDRSDRDFIRQLVEARYPAHRVVINKVSQS